MTTQTVETVIRASVAQQKEEYIQIAKAIHANPEIGNEEYFASEQLANLLQRANFTVQRNVAGHETAFYAVKDSGKEGPTIAYLAEYDALPGIGHACGHNIIGTTSCAAAIALAETFETAGGKVVVLGTPAEEGGPNGSAKGSFVKHGYLDEIDLALMLHPAGVTSLTPRSLAVDPLDFHFYGKTAHAAACPEEGINALEAVIQLFVGINSLRQHVSSDVRIHGIITHGGEAPNVVPEYASARFFIRAESWKKAEETSKRVRAIAEGAALATGATLKVERFQNEVQDILINDVVDQVLAKHLEAVGETVVYEQNKAFGSTDAGNISYVVPIAHGHIKIGPDDLVGHTAAFRECANSELGYEALIRGAEALARTGYEFLTNEEVLQEARFAYEKRLAEKQ